MALTQEQRKTIEWLILRPVEFGRLMGFTKLTDLHNGWIQQMLKGDEDETLQGHRGSYKTTCLSVALALIMILYPNDKTLFMRKTTQDIAEIVAQVKKILLSPYTAYIVKKLYGCELKITVDRFDQLSTNLAVNDARGTPQLVAQGIGGSMTGKHFDRIFTDDIVNVNDRMSKAERERTKMAYQELQNIKNRDGRIFNTGTPWHQDDAFTLMPPAKKYDCYSTGLIDEDTLEDIKAHMTASLFSANYELRHIASEDVIFPYPKKGADAKLVEQGICHLDSAFYGEDYTAFTICNKHDGNYYIFGKCWRKHVDDCINEIIEWRKHFNAGAIHTELNADKGMIAKELRNKGERVNTYTEKTNKFIKITSYLKTAWGNVYFVEGTDEEYIKQIEDYNENAEHDDCPDSASSILRILWKRSEHKSDDEELYML